MPANTPKTRAYLRVSTTDQSVDRQLMGLKDEADELHIEHASAASKSRPVFDAVLTKLQPGDTLLVWDLDRAFRSTLDAITTAQDLRARGVALKIAKMQIDTGTPEGAFFYTVIAAFAEMERRVLSERTREGLAAAKARGVALGRPKALAPDQIAEARRSVQRGRSPQTVANTLGVSRTTLQRALKRTGG